MDTAYPWAYRCDECGELVRVEDVAAHTDSHRVDGRLPRGTVGLTREDLPAE